HLKAAAPFLAELFVLVSGWIFAAALPRGKWVARLVLVAALVAAVFVVPGLRETTWRYLTISYAFTTDMSLPDMPLPYYRPGGTFGNLHGIWVVKAPLQCTPLIGLSLVLPRLDPKTKQRAAIVVLPCVALFLYLILRGNLPLYSALGVPWAYARYTLPGLPML